MVRTLVLLVLALLSSGCFTIQKAQGVLITSEPAGAQIFIDGADTGNTTPSMMDLGALFGGNHILELRREGFRPARRVLYQYTEGYTSRWVDGSGGPEIPPLPLWWTFEQFFFPFGINNGIVPEELYVKLYREDEPLLGFDLLAEKAAAAETDQ
ncbi:MAG: PEGA domain-containing protein [Planctomycetota bacterium]|nr:PEGA domain-containing protein [Planctomycetota bacterium]